ncbi:isoprenylcysteine carboxyl methyltransferase family protein [Jiella sonneratiae]|uniref:Methyltransferase n=1 Tax=Jiella sonneratiae TaxID=2816856 RepID=A0ABS3JAV1_9HYPH|nr:isoprenylcysteine carboxylmethyltransferase family protein [Jiella sonneratiae]MBO0905726.1 hypothetical protein [Jiella sonneratiae]
MVDAAAPLAVAILAYVTAQRLFELVVAARNTRRLLESGGYEVGAGHYPAIVALHAAWLAALWIFSPGRPVDLLLLALFVLVQLLRFWTLASIGRRWTTRIIVLPGERLVATGPYRFLPHPNYVVVVCEIFLLPAVFGLWAIAILFSLLNAAVLMIRIPAETSALQRTRG